MEVGATGEDHKLLSYIYIFAETDEDYTESFFSRASSSSRLTSSRRQSPFSRPCHLFPLLFGFPPSFSVPPILPILPTSMPRQNRPQGRMRNMAIRDVYMSVTALLAIRQRLVRITRSGGRRYIYPPPRTALFASGPKPHVESTAKEFARCPPRILFSGQLGEKYVFHLPSPKPDSAFAPEAYCSSANEPLTRPQDTEKGSNDEDDSEDYNEDDNEDDMFGRRLARPLYSSRPSTPRDDGRGRSREWSPVGSRNSRISTRTA